MVITDKMQEIKSMANHGNMTGAYKAILNSLVCGYGDMLPGWVVILFEYCERKEMETKLPKSVSVTKNLENESR